MTEDLVIHVTEVQVGDVVLSNSTDRTRLVAHYGMSWTISRVDAEHCYHHPIGGLEEQWATFKRHPDLLLLVRRRREYANPEMAARLRAYLEALL